VLGWDANEGSFGQGLGGKLSIIQAIFQILELYIRRIRECPGQSFPGTLPSFLCNLAQIFRQEPSSDWHSFFFRAQAAGGATLNTSFITALAPAELGGPYLNQWPQQQGKLWFRNRSDHSADDDAVEQCLNTRELSILTSQIFGEMNSSERP